MGLDTRRNNIDSDVLNVKLSLITFITFNTRTLHVPLSYLIVFDPILFIVVNYGGRGWGGVGIEN